MLPRKILSLWFFPIIGFVLGYVYAFMFVNGLVETWQFLGNPSENITRIISFGEENKIYVETVSGNVYSFHCCLLNNNKALPTPIQWMKEDQNNIKSIPERSPKMKFISWPLLFKAKQLVQMAYNQIESELLVKLALSDDGNLWIWHYGRGGLSGLLYLIYPFRGLLYGGILAALIRVGILLRRKIKAKQVL
jgi:hypothetical protein